MEQDEENTRSVTPASRIACSRATVAPTLRSQYSSGICIDSPTAFLAAKWTTWWIRCPANTPSSRARSRTSPSTRVTRRPVSFCTRSRAAGVLLEKSSTTTTSCPCSSSSTAVWLPMKPAPPVTRTVVGWATGRLLSGGWGSPAEDGGDVGREESDRGAERDERGDGGGDGHHDGAADGGRGRHPEGAGGLPGVQQRDGEADHRVGERAEQAEEDVAGRPRRELTDQRRRGQPDGDRQVGQHQPGRQWLQPVTGLRRHREADLARADPLEAGRDDTPGDPRPAAEHIEAVLPDQQRAAVR